MRHYLVYHIAEQGGFGFRDPVEGVRSGVATPLFSVTTKKQPTDLVGSVLWLISGEGEPGVYRLVFWFVVDRIGPSDDEETSLVEGECGAAFPGGTPLNGLPWFPAFFLLNGRFKRPRLRTSEGPLRSIPASSLPAFFQLGNKPIPDEYVGHFRAVFRQAGLPVPGEVAAPAVEAATDTIPARRQTVVAERVVRDSAIVALVKRLHDHHCQVCGIRLETPAGPYAEAAHIRPLGSPHDGPDEIGNVLCLCPNHHVLFDYGAFAVADDLGLLGCEGRLRIVSGHTISRNHLLHHRRRFGFDATPLGD